jgi:hypothetical protein
MIEGSVDTYNRMENRKWVERKFRRSLVRPEKFLGGVEID